MQLTENMVAISFNTSLQKYGGDIAVASMSILTSIMQFVMLLLPGLVQGAQPLLSYNLGAKNISRVKKTFRKSLYADEYNAPPFNPVELWLKYRNFAKMESPSKYIPPPDFFAKELDMIIFVNFNLEECE